MTVTTQDGYILNMQRISGVCNTAPVPDTTGPPTPAAASASAPPAPIDAVNPFYAMSPAVAFVSGNAPPGMLSTPLDSIPPSVASITGTLPGATTRVDATAAGTPPGQVAAKLPVMLDHAFIASANVWFNPGTALGVRGNLPVNLANAGYDVWLINHRGTEYSSEHVSLPTNERNYWEFGADELALLDLPPLLAKVLLETGASKVHFVGYNQGATLPVMAAASLPVTFASKIASASLIGPFCYLGNVTSPALNQWGNGATPDDAVYNSGITHGTYNISYTETLIEAFSNFGINFVDLVSTGGTPTELLNNVTGINCCVSEAAQDLEAYQDDGWVVASYRTLIQYQQAIRSTRFQRWDYGSVYRNRFEYGTPVPPQYFPQRIPSSMAFLVVSGAADWFADPPNIGRLVSRLQRTQILQVPNYAHLDLMFSDNVYNDVHAPILKFIAAHDAT
eukprot:jgi/Mesen1/365/ME000001S02676